jgi:hypothetical protein
MDYKIIGGGGTLFECNWEFMMDNEIYPKILIIFTDMRPNKGWGDPYYCDNVIFLGYKSENIIAPFGETITIS